MKFLDLKGLQALWTKVLASRTIVETSNESAENAAKIAAVESASEVVGKKYTLSLQNVASNASVDTKVEAAKRALYGTDIPAENPATISGLKSAVDALSTASNVTVEKLATAESGYAASYVVKQNNAQVGATINIPKDFLVRSAELKTATASDSIPGVATGDKYIDFVINTPGDDATASHVYLPINDLVDTYTGENGVTIDASTNKVSAVVDSAANGNEFLSVSDTGLKVSGVSTAISTAVNDAKAELIGNSETDTASSDTIEGAKKYADSIVSDKNVTATGDSYVSASASNNAVTVAATQKTKDSLALADSALQGVDTAQKGTNVKVTLGTSEKNVTVAVDETALTGTLAEKADKVGSATAGNFAGLDANGNLTDSGSKAADFATAAQGAKADTAIQNVTGETATTNSNYVAVSVEAAKTGTDVTLTSHANVTTHTVSDAVVSTADGLATAADVKSYVDGQKNAIDTAIASMDADLDASGTAQNGGIFVMSGVTQTDGLLTSVDSTEVERAGAAAAAEARLRGASDAAGYVANDTLAALRNDLNAMGGDAGSIAQQIQTEIEKLDSDVNVASEASAGHVLSTNTNTTTNAAANPVANVLTSLTITDGKITAATGETIGAIPASELQAIFNPTPNPGE